MNTVANAIDGPRIFVIPRRISVHCSFFSTQIVIYPDYFLASASSTSSHDSNSSLTPSCEATPGFSVVPREDENNITRREWWEAKKVYGISAQKFRKVQLKMAEAVMFHRKSRK